MISGGMSDWALSAFLLIFSEASRATNYLSDGTIANNDTLDSLHDSPSA